MKYIPLCSPCSFTYEVAPVFVLMELEVLRGLRQMVGWTQGDGLFCPGGSTSNMYAMNLARYRLFPEVKSQGMWALPRLAIFTSSQVRNALKLQIWWVDATATYDGETHSLWVSYLFVCFVFVLFPQSHYSVKKGAAFMGMGLDNVIIVNVDDR